MITVKDKKGGEHTYFPGTAHTYNNGDKTEIVRTEEDKMQSCYEFLIRDVKLECFETTIKDIVSQYLNRSKDDLNEISISVSGNNGFAAILNVYKRENKYT